MAYTDPVPSLSAGQKLTASYLNTYLKDNQAFMVRPPECSILAGAAVSTTTGTQTVLDGTSENFDPFGMHSNTTNPSRINCLIDGRYLAMATIQYINNGTGNRAATIVVNGTTAYEGMLVSAVTGNSTICSVTRTLNLVVGDYVEARSFQTSGGNLNTTLLEFALLWKSFT